MEKVGANLCATTTTVELLRTPYMRSSHDTLAARGRPSVSACNMWESFGEPSREEHGL